MMTKKLTLGINENNKLPTAGVSHHHNFGGDYAFRKKPPQLVPKRRPMQN